MVLYRDGISEGLYNIILKTEIKQIEQIMEKLTGTSRVSVICVNKRIITRFFSTEKDRLGNPMSGTVVNTDVVSNNVAQFFLVSQSTTQGTVSPTSYDVIMKNEQWDLIHYQKLTYKLCHLYYNWTVSGMDNSCPTVD